MTWRQSGASRSNDSQSINEVTKFRLENTRLKIQIDNLKKQAQPRLLQNNKLAQLLTESKNRQDRLKSQLIKISAILGCEQISKVNSSEEALGIIEKKIIQNKQKISSLQKQLKSANDHDHNSGHKILQKQKQIELYLQRIQQKQQQIKNLTIKNNLLLTQVEKTKTDSERKDALLGEFSHKVSQLQIERKDIEQEMENMRVNNHDFQSKKVKKQCEQLLNQINVKDDDYLRSYLLKNYRYQNGSNPISRKNKYDFIFQN